MRRLIFPVLLCLAGCAVLLALGVWQLQRLEWKEAILAEIDARIAAPPAALPDAPDPEADRYLPVALDGVAGPQRLRVLVSVKDAGAGHRVIMPLTLGTGRVILADLGFVPIDAPLPEEGLYPVALTGNLHWPDEVDSWTPPPEGPLWFARDVAAMARALGTDPVLVVARDLSAPDLAVTPLPVDTAAIPNDHLEYAITWFLLALVWAAMSGLLIVRTIRRGRA